MFHFTLFELMTHIRGNLSFEYLFDGFLSNPRKPRRVLTFRNSDFQNIKERKDIQWLLCLVSVGIKRVGILTTCTGVVADVTNERDSAWNRTAKHFLQKRGMFTILI